MAVRNWLAFTELVPRLPVKVSAVARPPLSTLTTRTSERAPTPALILARAASMLPLGIRTDQEALGEV